MPGRPTGNARHLTRPADAIYLATMEEGLYEVDVRTLGVRQLYEDANAAQRRKAARRYLRPAPARLPRQGALLGPGPARVFEQRRVRRRVDAAGRAVGLPCGVERPELEGGAPQPVHGGDGPGRSRGQSDSGPRPDLVRRLGPQVAHPHAARRRRLARVSPAEGEPRLRRRPRVEHRVAAHPGHRRARSAHDDARDVVAVSADVRAGQLFGHRPALHVPARRRRFRPLARPDRVRQRRHGEVGVHQHADRER